ncbi:MAG: TIGR04150 pseudo-rSAM protein [Macellibacteroides fermentans]|uniref:TIGR04150 pseudo-rSAM protein n=1 Tax=Macellibacteroides fermentans TaxID=879969 RepID=UPI003ACFDA50
MMSNKNSIDYWFTIEPYVYVNVINSHVLLYNTLDGQTIESDNANVVGLLKEILCKNNSGVVLLSSENYKQNDINNFINEVREKFFGDLIEVHLSNGKPVQILPYINLSNSVELYKKHNLATDKKMLECLSEISIYVDYRTDLKILIPFLKSLPDNILINVLGNLEEVANYVELLIFLNQLTSMKNIICPYTKFISLQTTFNNNFSYSILVDFQVDMKNWRCLRKLLINQEFPFEYIFEITSIEDYKQANHLISQFKIEKYQMKPIFTGNNIKFFEDYIFLTKDDILSTSMSMRDFFANKSMNIYDFGKISIMPNGDVQANLNYPTLGNISTHSILEIIIKEVEQGYSWFRIRDQKPCNNCIYQWLCPSPSNYEIIMNRPNLCHV